MDALFSRMFLLAERSRVDYLSDSFRTRPGASDQQGVLIGLMILAGIIVGVWLLSRWLKMSQRNRACDSPSQLFRALCRAHGLRLSDRWLLARLARAQQLKDPARLFLEPQRFEPGKITPALRPQAGRLKALRDRLFVEPPKEKPTLPGKERQGQPRHRRPEKKRQVKAASPAAPLPLPAIDIAPWSSAGDGVPTGA